MAVIRPELRAHFWRWREAIFGGCLAFVGMYWALAGNGSVVRAAGTSFAIVGALLVFAGIQRTRFRRGSGGQGVVQVDERQVVYYGPRDGGVVSVDALERVELDPSPPSGAWVLTDPDNRSQPLMIPTDAENAEALFDMFAALDGIRTEHMLARLAERPHERVTIWEAPSARAD